MLLKPFMIILSLVSLPVTIKTYNKDSKHCYKLKTYLYDHGFHWATNSAAGMFVRTKIEIVSLNGDIEWEQYYTMTKDEAKSTYSRSALNMYKGMEPNEHESLMVHVIRKSKRDFYVIKHIEASFINICF